MQIKLPSTPTDPEAVVGNVCEQSKYDDTASPWINHKDFHSSATQQWPIPDRLFMKPQKKNEQSWNFSWRKNKLNIFQHRTNFGQCYHKLFSIESSSKNALFFQDFVVDNFLWMFFKCVFGIVLRFFFALSWNINVEPPQGLWYAFRITMLANVAFSSNDLSS